MKELIINKKYNNKKLNTFLLDTFPSLKMSNIGKALKNKDIKVNSKRVSENIILHENDHIAIYISDEFLNSDFTLKIVFEDENIIIVNKPIGVSVTKDNYLNKTLTEILEEKHSSKIFPCHRIDRNTTGIVVFAKNENALNILLEKFKNDEIEKRYICYVYGIPKETSKTLKAYLFKDNSKSMVYISDTPKTGYREIVTSYNVLSTNKEQNYSCLDVLLGTGRTHQIRAHLAHTGFPILGDGKYGINSINKSFNLKHQILCAYKLKFNFKTNSGVLNYLNGLEFKTEKPRI